MLDNITVDKALSKGHKMITYPGLLIMFGTMALTFLLGFQKSTPVWVWPIGLCAALIFPWFFWSIKVVKWKVWAFDSVRNVHELKKRAIQQNLIWPDSSIFNKTEIWSRDDKQKWELLQDKFLKKDEVIYENDVTMPGEKIIFYSKGKSLFAMSFMLGCIAIGIYIIIQSNSYVIGIILCLVGGYLAYGQFKNVINKTPQIILNNEGIQTINTPFFSWSEVFNEDVDIEGSGKHTHYYLVYDHPGGTENLQIDDYDINYKELRRLLRVYKGRSITKTHDE